MDQKSAPGLEREYKFLLDSSQYRALWDRLRVDCTVRSQENHFFDRDDLLRRVRWALRLRLERFPDHAGSSQPGSTPPPLEEIDWSVARAVVTLKGPPLSVEQWVVRQEIEDELGIAAALAACSGGRLPLADLPGRISDFLHRQLANPEAPEQEPGDRQPPELFFSFASFANLRLARRTQTPAGTVEVALDRTLAGDGRIRHELEIEWEGEEQDAVQAVLAELDTAALQPTIDSKLSWALGLQERRTG